LNRLSPPEDGLISPRQGKNDPRLGMDALMVAVPSALNSLVRRMGARPIPFSDGGLYGLYVSARGAIPPLALSGPFLGAPHAVMGMEKLIALGARRFWFLGWCGSLQSRLRVGDLILPTGALSEEGTSRHYPIGNRKSTSDPELNRRLGQALQRQGVAFSHGTIWTTDAPYRETPAKIERYQNRGILAVEMETSALMTLAVFRAVQMTGLLVVSDELFDGSWHPGFSSQALKQGTRVAGDTLFHLAQGMT